MTPKQKANDLFMQMRENCWHNETIRKGGSVYGELTFYHKEKAIQCALIAVNEILSLRMIGNMGRGDSSQSEAEYWQEVKLELEKL